MLDFNDQIRSNFPRWLLCPMDQRSRVQVNLRWRIHSGLWWRSETQCQCETGLVLWEKLWVAVLCHLPSVVGWQLVCLCWLVGNTEDDLRLQSSAANRLIGEVVQSRRRLLLGPSPGWKRLLALSHLRIYANQPTRPPQLLVLLSLIPEKSALMFRMLPVELLITTAGVCCWYDVCVDVAVGVV